jgi:iron complex outermembrane recepter protein
VSRFMFAFSRLLSLACRRRFIPNLTLGLALAVALVPSAFGQLSQVTGVVTDPSGAIVVGVSVSLTKEGTHTTFTSTTNEQGAYQFSAVAKGEYTLAVKANGFKIGTASVVVTAGQTSVVQNVALSVGSSAESIQVLSGTFENAYRVDNLAPATPFGPTPIVNLPYTIDVISHQLIDDTMSRNFKEVAKYLPLVSFQEMQGPEILRPETRGMQGTNMQGDRMDGMGFAVTVPFPIEEYEQIEVLNGVGGSMYGPSNPSGTFNFVTKKPTEEPLREAELEYEGRSVLTGHVDLGGRLGPNKIFGYRINALVGDGTGYVTNSQLRRQLASGAFDIRPFAHTVIGGNYNYYNLYQHGYPGWFSYNPTLDPTATCTTAYNAGCFSRLPTTAPDPERQGYGQRFLGSNTNNQIGEVRVTQDLGQNWRINLGVLQQISFRNLTTAVNAFFDSTGDYQTEAENIFQGTISGRFQVKSDLGYVTGRFFTGKIRHDVVFGSTGYKFSTWQAKNSLTAANNAKGAQVLCSVPGLPSSLPAADCYANIDNPQIDANPGYQPYTGEFSLYVTSIIHQQGFNIGDTITLTPHWLLRVAASQDWTWTNNYKETAISPSKVDTVRLPTVGNYISQGASPTGSVEYKPARNQTAYVTFADSIQAPDTAPASSGTVFVANANQPLPPYRSTQLEIGYKVESRRLNFTADVFRLRRPFADTEQITPTTACTSQTGWASTDICVVDQIIGQQINFGAEAMLSGNLTRSLKVTGGITGLSPKLTHTFVLLPAGNQYVSASCTDPAGTPASALICPSYVTNNKDLVGIPDVKSNILAEYQIPSLRTAFFTFDWQHVSHRPVDDMNSYYVPQYNLFDVGGRYSATVFGRLVTWLVTVNNVSNVHYYSTLGPGSITGQSSADLAHLGEPRLITASMRYMF